MNVAFVCVQNAGRSQMARAFAKRQRTARGLEKEVGILMGGTQPAESVHAVAIEAMAEVGIDISDRTPREITVEKLQNTEYVITMGCSAEDVCPATWTGDDRDWDLPDPHGKPLDEVRDIRDDIERRVGALFDELAHEFE